MTAYQLGKARIAGIVIAMAGAALALYSFPFVTWVAFSFFLIGLGGLGVGLWLFASGVR